MYIVSVTEGFTLLEDYLNKKLKINRYNHSSNFFVVGGGGWGEGPLPSFNDVKDMA